MRRKTKIDLGCLFLIGMIGMLSTGCGGRIGSLEEMDMGTNDESGFDEAGQLDFTEAAVRLKALGITGITDEVVTELEKGCAQIPEEAFFSKTAMILMQVGSGTYDYENGSWTPGENNVYSFDMEVYNLDKMYTDFLRGVAAIGNGELEFANIQEDTSHVDWDKGTGKRSVTFDWNGDTYTLTANNQNDWFDVEVVKQLNKIIREKGGKKQLYATSDGYQECILFYQDADWAKEFARTIDLELDAF